MKINEANVWKQKRLKAQSYSMDKSMSGMEQLIKIYLTRFKVAKKEPKQNLTPPIQPKGTNVAKHR